MRWHLDEHGRLVISVRKREQRSLKATRHRDQDGHFDSDEFMRQLLAPLVENDEYTWLGDGSIGDLTSAPMLGILGDEMPGPDDALDAMGLGLYHVGCWTHGGRLRQVYQPVLKRWAFMAYQVTSPQHCLADAGQCVWEGGDLWDTKEAAQSAVVMLAADQGQEPCVSSTESRG